jgi:hypothetical protein
MRGGSGNDQRRTNSLIALFGGGLAALACSSRLEPTLLLEGGSAGEASTLPRCTSAESEGRSYDLCPTPLAFDAAAHDCMLRGATLAAIGSEPENTFVASSAYPVVDTNLWIGGRRGEDDAWRWLDESVFWRGSSGGELEPGAFANWQPGEPNDGSTVSTDPERCLALTLDGNDWNDRVCSVSLPYVCERGDE